MPVRYASAIEIVLKVRKYDSMTSKLGGLRFGSDGGGEARFYKLNLYLLIRRGENL